jgi:hypothetical protein
MVLRAPRVVETPRERGEQLLKLARPHGLPHKLAATNPLVKAHADLH